MRIIEISSRHNESLKKWRQLQQSRKERMRRKQLVIEGNHLLREARHQQCRFDAFMYDEREALPAEWHAWLQKQGIPTYALRSTLYRDLMDTDKPQGMAAVIDIPKTNAFHMGSERSLVLLLDQIQDPGNLGTIFRTAAAVGVSFVGLGKGTVDPYNPKVVRSAAGALFHLAFDTVDLPGWITRFRATGGQVIGTAPDGKQVYYEVPYPAKTAFLLGNEGQGIAPALLGMTDRGVRLPLPGRVESLNVATAGAVLLYEVLRQRGQD